MLSRKRTPFSSMTIPPVSSSFPSRKYSEITVRFGLYLRRGPYRVSRREAALGVDEMRGENGIYQG
jgi:hypothetical protein